MSLKMFIKRTLTEGGNALKSTKPIKQENVKETLESFVTNVLEPIGLSEGSFVQTGSAGKRHPDELSGDIDLAVAVDALLTKDLSEIVYKIEQLNISPNIDIREMKGINVLSISWPINNQTPDYVQIDLMPTESLYWSEWSYFSPHYTESNFRGLFRNELMFACAKYTNMNITEYDEDGVPLEWNRMFFDLSKGLLTGTQSRIGKTGILQNPFTKEKQLITNDPDEVVKLLFGFEHNSGNARTFEQTLDLLLLPEYENKEMLVDILEMASVGIERKGQLIPEILQFEIDKLKNI